MKRLLLTLFLLLAGASYAEAQGTIYNLSPPAPNAQLRVCPSPDNGYPCPVTSAVFSDVALTLAIPQPVQLGPSGFAVFYIASGTYVIQLSGPGYGSANRTTVSIGAGAGGATNVTVNPATCTTGQSFFNTVTQQYLQCIATNTLAAVGDFLGTGAGTTPTATSGLPSVIVGSGSSANGTTVAGIQNTSQGDSIVVVGRCTASCTINLPTDSQGNTYTTILNPCTVGTNPTGFFIASNIVGGPDTVTFNVSGGTVNFAWIETTPAALDAVSTCATNAGSTTV